VTQVHINTSVNTEQSSRDGWRVGSFYE